MSDCAIQIRSLSKTFSGGRRALDHIDLQVAAGEMVALIGASGSGKSTLLRHIAGLSVGNAGQFGEVLVHGRLVQFNGKLSREIRAIRSDVGFVFQQFNLVARLPVIVNVMAGMLSRMPRWRRLSRRFSRTDLALGMQALQRVGIADCGAQRASTLSGGQQQRAAIARTLVQRARVVLADEPIASLDPESSRRVMELLTQINRTDGATVLVSLHQVSVAMRYCSRTVALSAGRVVFDGPSSQLTPQLLRELYGTQADEILALPDSIGALNSDLSIRNPGVPPGLTALAA